MYLLIIFFDCHTYPIFKNHNIKRMRVILLFIFLLLLMKGYAFIDSSGEKLQELSKSKTSLESPNIQQNINYLWLKTNIFHEIQLQPESYYVLLAKIDSSQTHNLNLYSMDAPFGYLFEAKEVDFSLLASEEQDEMKVRKQSEKTARDFINQIKENPKLQQKISAKIQYKHFLSIQNIDLQMKQTTQIVHQKLLIIGIFFPQQHHSNTRQLRKNKYNFVSLISTNQTFIDEQSLQNPFQYKLQKNQLYSIAIPAKILKNPLPHPNDHNTKIDLYSQDHQQTLMFHIMHLVGDYQYNVSLINWKQDQQDHKRNLVLMGVNLTQSNFHIDRSLFVEKSEFPVVKYLKKTDDSLLDQSEIHIQIMCISKTCNFISVIERVSDIKKVIPGLPYLYSISQVQIFQLTNPFDLQILIDINKKNGLLQYEICSIKDPKSVDQNQCIRQLKKPDSSFHVLEVKQKDDKIHPLGRNHQIFINPEHEEYCYTCTYYIALYAEYDNVLGMITFQNTLSRAIIPEGSSVTKILKRNHTDSYQIFGLESSVLFENFSGQYQIYFEVIDFFSEHDLSIQMQKKKNKLTYDLQPLTQDQNYYAVDLKDFIASELKKINQNDPSSRKSNNTIYRLSIQTKNNFPSTYYSMVVVNEQTRKIILKDGVPFFNKQKNQLSVFKYLTENLQTESFGTIIINSNQIQQIGLEIYGKCLEIQDIQTNQKKLKIEKEETSTLQTLKNRVKMSSLAGKKVYQMQKIENTKINLMANRIDIIIEPKMCKSYTIKIINNGSKQSYITYEILVSFIDSIILPLNNQIPGILQYPGKIIQIYEIYVPQKTNISIMINFCRSAKSRMKIYKNKQALLIQSADEKVFFNSESEFEESIYLARAGVFYVTIQFFGFSNILEYTILVKQHEIEQGFYYVDLSKYEQQIGYEVKDGRFFSTTYELYFSPIFLKHWSKDIQRDVQYFETNYFILQSNSYPLLKRASNCKGQFFSDIVNHHQHFRQVKLQKQKLKFHPQEKAAGKQNGHLANYERGYYSYEYETNNPLSFLIIVPVIGKSTANDQITIIRYWQFDKKSRQPYQITQLYNGKLYSVFEHWFLSVIIWAEEIIDFHPYENFLLMMILFCSCLPVSCCFLICAYRTKVNIEFYCSKLGDSLRRLFGRQEESQSRSHVIQISQRQMMGGRIDEDVGFHLAMEDENQNIGASQTQIQFENITFGVENNSLGNQNSSSHEENPQQQLQESPLT